MVILSLYNCGLSKLKFLQGDICFIRKADAIMIPSGPLGYDLRSCSNVEGRRTVGQYFDFDFYCLFLYLGLIRFSDGACVGRGGIKKSGEAIIRQGTIQ